MNVGLPGTGIGALFYAFSVVIMVIMELWHLVNNRSPTGRLWLSLRLGTMLSGIILSLVLLDRLLFAIVAASGAADRFPNLTANALAVVVATLAAVVSAANIAGWIVSATDRRSRRAAERAES